MPSLRAARLLLVALGLTGLVAPLASARSAPIPASEPMSVQGCNTRCQSAQTDCALRCDGDVGCIKGCQKTADSCVEKCQSAAKTGA